ncbi:Uncharacterised protein [uncultured archaeon]|nr:Uncharacterised protein [uncultured archaeon]
MNPENELTRETVGQPAAPPPVIDMSGGGHKPSEVEQAWDKMVTSLIRKSKGLSEGESVTLPTGETGHYVKYAYDAYGRLSMGKGRGRKRVRFTAHKANEARAFGAIFNTLLSGALVASWKRAQAEAVAASTEENKVEPKPITPEKFQELQKWVAKKAEVIHNEPKKATAKATRKRQQLARRQNFGLLPGNQARACFSK